MSRTLRHRMWGDADVDVVLGARRLDDDGGYVLAFTALMLVPLMFFVAMAIDLGAWLAQAARIQRAADAAALAGVVWMPDTANASAAATTAARANGYVGGAGVTVTVAPGSQNTDYQASIAAPAPRFFSQMLGLQAFNITRSASARFNQPIPLGSPTSRMGNDVSNTANCPQSQPTPSAPCGPQPMLWSAINGPYAPFANGDPYSTKCSASTSGSACDVPGNPNGAANGLYRNTGFRYAIDVAAADVGRTLTFATYDLGTYPRTYGSPVVRNIGNVAVTNNSRNLTITSGSSTFNGTDVGQPISGTGIPAGATVTAVTDSTHAQISVNATSTGTRTLTITASALGSKDCLNNYAPFNAAPYSGATWTSQHCQTGDSGSMTTEAMVYDNDGIDLTITFGSMLSGCRQVVVDDDNPELYKNRWATVCSFVAARPGIYPVTIKSSNIAGYTDQGTGINAFSLRVTGGTTTSLYALDDLSIWTNTPASDSRFYLAEIPQVHRGKDLVLDLYDPGDGSGSSAYTMQVLMPPSGAPSVVPSGGTGVGCNYNASASATKGPATPNTSATCTITTKNASSSAGIYNSRWLRIVINIPPTYTCSADCWWTILYDFGTAGLPTDRTVWSINVVGDPVRLIS